MPTVASGRKSRNSSSPTRGNALIGDSSFMSRSTVSGRLSWSMIEDIEKQLAYLQWRKQRNERAIKDTLESTRLLKNKDLQKLSAEAHDFSRKRDFFERELYKPLTLKQYQVNSLATIRLRSPARVPCSPTKSLHPAKWLQLKGSRLPQSKRTAYFGTKGDTTFVILSFSHDSHRNFIGNIGTILLLDISSKRPEISPSENDVYVTHTSLHWVVCSESIFCEEVLYRQHFSSRFTVLRFHQSLSITILSRGRIVPRHFRSVEGFITPFHFTSEIFKATKKNPLSGNKDESNWTYIWWIILITSNLSNEMLHMHLEAQNMTAM